MLKPEDFTKAGYKKFELSSFEKQSTLAEYALHKRIDDEKGIKYYITVYVYDYKKRFQEGSSYKEYGFAPKVQFRNAANHAVNTELIIDDRTSIEEIEATFEVLFTATKAEYYSFYD